MEETHMDISVRIGLSVLESPLPVALMGFCCLRIHFKLKLMSARYPEPYCISIYL